MAPESLWPGTVVVKDKYQFECGNPLEVWRAQTLFTKEPGTVAWLRREIKPDDVFFDIGANIGLYTVVAAKQGAFVIAFEPHAANIQSLLTNVRLNGLLDRVVVSPRPLADLARVLDFNYFSLEPGSSDSQLGHTRSEKGPSFTPVRIQMMMATTLDTVVYDEGARPPSLIKLDVDGNELRILHGGSKLLDSGAVRSIQVEMHPNSDQAIAAYMEQSGYGLVERHYTSIGKKHMENGIPPDQIAHNAIFQRGKA